MNKYKQITLNKINNKINNLISSAIKYCCKISFFMMLRRKHTHGKMYFIFVKPHFESFLLNFCFSKNQHREMMYLTILRRNFVQQTPEELKI